MEEARVDATRRNLTMPPLKVVQMPDMCARTGTADRSCRQAPSSTARASTASTGMRGRELRSYVHKAPPSTARAGAGGGTSPFYSTLGSRDGLGPVDGNYGGFGPTVASAARRAAELVGPAGPKPPPTRTARRRGHPVPGTILPRQYHVREALPVRPESDVYSADWDADEEVWQVTVFPAQRPVGREQVGHLRNCLNRMLATEQKNAELSGRVKAGRQPSVLELLQTSPDPDRTYAVLHSIYAAGIHELARQVSAHCGERGTLLVNLWTSAEALRETMLKIKEEGAVELASRHQKAELELAEASEKLANFEDFEGQHLSKAQELVRVVQSRDKLVAMMKTMQAALASVEEQLRTSHAARQAAEAKLRTWLPHVEAYSSAAALEALEAHTAAARDSTPGADSTHELVERAALWRDSIREQAAQLADWEQPPSLPEAVPLTPDSLKMLMNDTGRILGAVVCLGQLQKDAGAPSSLLPGGESPGPEEPAADAEELAAYQEAIASLQHQLSEAKTREIDLQRQLSAAKQAGAAGAAGGGVGDGAGGSGAGASGGLVAAAELA